MPTIEELQKEIEHIQQRNKRVESDKAWETSWTRKIVILILTYALVVIFFNIAGIGSPFINAIVPTLGFFLSTLTIPFIKKMWLKNFYRNGN